MQVSNLVGIIKNILARIENLETKNNSVLVARINLLEERIKNLENKQQQ